MAPQLLKRSRMPRKNLIRTDCVPYHVTARANNREPFHLAPERFWALLGSELWVLSLVSGVEIHALVLMPNHFHLILTTPLHDLGKAMDLFMSEITRRLNRTTGRSGRVFGGPYHWTLINSTRYFHHVLKYVYRNPVKAGLVKRVEDYPFSTLHGLLGNSWLPVPIYFTRVAMELGLPSPEPDAQLEWLNRPFPNEFDYLIGKGLRKPCFEDLKDPNTRRAYPIFDQLI